MKEKYEYYRLILAPLLSGNLLFLVLSIFTILIYGGNFEEKLENYSIFLAWLLGGLEGGLIT
jgi:membrane associated rhomboid family serine protease